MDNRPQCVAIRKTGQRCAAPALPNTTLCFAHAADRSESRSRGGRNSAHINRAVRRLPTHLVTLQETLMRLIDGIEKHRVEPREAEAVASLAGRLIELAKFALDHTQALAVEEEVKALRSEVETALRREASG